MLSLTLHPQLYPPRPIEASLVEVWSSPFIGESGRDEVESDVVIMEARSLGRCPRLECLWRLNCSRRVPLD